MDLINNNYNYYVKITLIILNILQEFVYALDVNVEFANAIIFRNVKFFISRIKQT